MYIKCQNKECGRPIAKGTEKGLLRITRKGHRVLAYGKDFNVVVTCPFCFEEQILEVEGGVLKVDLTRMMTDEEYSKKKENGDFKQENEE